MNDTGQEMAYDGKERKDKRPLNILLVEDEKPIASLIKTLLNGDGHNITSFESAEEALNELKKAKEAGRSYDWVITDRGLAGQMDGFGLVSAIKRDKLGSPFVTMISGSAGTIQRDNTQVQLEVEGIHQLMGKPFDLKELSNSAQTARQFQRQFQNPQS